MTLGLALVLVGALMIYCGIRGRSLRRAIVGRGEAGGDGALIQ